MFLLVFCLFLLYNVGQKTLKKILGYFHIGLNIDDPQLQASLSLTGSVQTEYDSNTHGKYMAGEAYSVGEDSEVTNCHAHGHKPVTSSPARGRDGPVQLWILRGRGDAPLRVQTSGHAEAQNGDQEVSGRNERREMTDHSSERRRRSCRVGRCEN